MSYQRNWTNIVIKAIGNRRFLSEKLNDQVSFYKIFWQHKTGGQRLGIGRPVKTLAIVPAKDKNVNKDYANGRELHSTIL